MARVRVSFRVRFMVNARARVSVRVWFRVRVMAGAKARAVLVFILGLG